MAERVNIEIKYLKDERGKGEIRKLEDNWVRSDG